MGFFSWFFCSILVVALVLLLFPFSVRIEFEAGERGARAFFFFFKKKVYEYKKSWGKEVDERRETRDESEVGSRKSEVGSEERESQSSSTVRVGNHNVSDCTCEKDPVKSSTGSESAPPTEAVAKKPAETPKTEKMEAPAGETLGIDNTQDASLRVEGAAISNNLSEAKEKALESTGAESVKQNVPAESSSKRSDEDPVKSSSVVDVKESKNLDEEKPETLASDSKEKPKKEKRKLSDREFWTILLTPDLDARAFRYVLKILGAVFSLFRIRFYDCFVEGIRSDYQTMGYIAAVNGILKAYPYVGDWDLRMDWKSEKELRAAGSVRLSISLLRVFCFVLETLVLAGILALSFWRRRARVIKTNELPELGFVRRKILDFILED